MNHKELTWKAADGIDIYGQAWWNENPKASMILVHGMGEHSGRYSEYAQFLANHGIAVIAYDHRGHGKSGGKRGHTPSYEILLEGITDALKQSDSLFPNTPKFIFGHSMGGNVTLNYALRRKPKVNGIIASAPWLKLAFDPPALQIALGKLVVGILPGLQQRTKLDASAISSIPAECEIYKKDPLVHDFITPSFFLGTFDAAAWALENAADFNLPLYIYHGTSDKLIAPEGTKLFSAKVKSDLTTKYWEGQYHESHHDKLKNQVMQSTADWILAHI